MNIATERILMCNQSEPLAYVSGRMVDLMNENGFTHVQTQHWLLWSTSPLSAGINTVVHTSYDD